MRTIGDTLVAWNQPARSAIVSKIEGAVVMVDWGKGPQRR
jgi:hypothetical protein